MAAESNPFLAPSELPYGLPPFDRIYDEHFVPAFELGMTQHAGEVRDIAHNPEPPTFDNTLVALERSGELLERVSTVFFNLSSSDTSATLQEIRENITPRLAEHADGIFMDRALFARISQLFDTRSALDLDPESAWLLERYHREFLRSGAALNDAEQQRLRELNSQLSILSTRFQDNLLADTNDLAVRVRDVRALGGLSDDAVAAAAEAASAAGNRGEHLLKLGLPTGQPALASLDDRELRERIFTASIERAHRGNGNDNCDVLIEIATLRAERATLLGFANHAEYVIEDQTAGKADAVFSLLERLAPAAVLNANAEAVELEKYVDQDGADPILRPWDWAYYAERVRQDRYKIDAAELRPYFELERVLVDGVFYAASQLYGLRFHERNDLPKYHPEVRIFEVFDAEGIPLGLFLGDYYTRDSKRGGAWMNNFVEQSRLHNAKPVVVNNLNIARPPDGEPTLLTFDEVTTMFHEFGHALHSLLSDVRYPKLSGANVPRDFVEFPSQVNEMWALWPEVLANYAKHFETGESLPTPLVNQLVESRQYGEGFATTEYLAASLLDQSWHRIKPWQQIEDVARFEETVLGDAGIALAAVPPRYRSTYFAHVFSGGYDAGYYSYIWSEVLDADVVEWFTENGGLTRDNGERFRRELLSKGGSMDPVVAFRNFRGRDPVIEPLLSRRGLTMP